MAKTKYHFNQETLSYEKVRLSVWQHVKNILLHVVASCFLGIVFFLIFVFMVESPYQKKLREENKKILAQYKMLNKRMNQVQETLNDMQQRDDNLYRVIFQADPIPSSMRNGEFYQTSRYEDIKEYTSSELVVNTVKRADEIARQLYVQSCSFDDIVKMSKDQEKRLQCIPAIQPVYNKDLKRMASGYGRRIDPIYHTIKFHAGMDFSAPIGTEIFATGNGVVTSAGWRQGYGKCVTIDHGYGYETLYAHMDGFEVHVGKKVVRGDVIGYVGNTGKSTGPHLHYEVHVRGQAVNPANYYFRDLSPEDYDKMLQITTNNAKVFD